MIPRISVVIPTYRRPALLTRCLAALAAQTVPTRDYEIVVVHDGPADAFAHVVAESQLDGDRRIRFLELAQRRGPAAARNHGWRAARGSIIAFTDDDTVPDPNWLANGLAYFESGADAATGRIVMPLRDAPTDYELDALGLTRADFVTANCFVRRSLLERLGGFDERFKRAWREDSDLHFTLVCSGARIARAADAVVIHPIRPARWGVSIGQQRKIVFDALLYKKHPALYRAFIRRRPRWDYYATVGALGVCVAGVATGAPAMAAAAGVTWAALTARFCAARLAPASKRAAHVAEMIVTSAAIPPTAVFWRIVGAFRFRTLLL